MKGKNTYLLHTSPETSAKSTFLYGQIKARKPREEKSELGGVRFVPMSVKSRCFLRLVFIRKEAEITKKRQKERRSCLEKLNNKCIKLGEGK